MATVQSMSLDRLLSLEADTVIGGHIDGSGNLILEQHDGSTIDAGSALAAIPDASETVKGKVELATNAEATAGSSTTHAVTPAGLAAAVGTLVPDASTTVKGKVELATTGEATTGTSTTLAVTPAGLKAFLDVIYPVGSIYMSTVSTNPNTLFGVGTWTAIGGQMLMGANGTYTAGSTGGAATATLTSTELPAHVHSGTTLSAVSNGAHVHSLGEDQDGSTGSTEWVNHSTGITGSERNYNNAMTSAGAHTHTVTGNTGSAGTGSAFSILPPYVAVYIWKRTA